MEAIILIGIIIAYIALWRSTGVLHKRIDRLESRLNSLHQGTEVPPSEKLFDINSEQRDSASAPPSPPEISPATQTAPPSPPQPSDEAVRVEFEQSFPNQMSENITVPGDSTEPRVKSPEPRPSRAETIVLEKLRERIRNFGPSDPNLGWEMALTTFWFPRIGVAALAVAAVFFLTLISTRMGPSIRVAIGYIVAASLIYVARRLESKYAMFARVLFAGGFALTYFVTFATHYIPFARPPGFENPVYTLVGLIVVVIAWALVAQRRKSRIMAATVTILGHLTIGLSTFAVQTPAQYSVVGIVALSAGSAFFLLRNRWYYVASLGAVGSYLNHFLVLYQGESSGLHIEFIVGMSVLSLYLLIFALSELLAPEELRRRTIPVWFRTSLVTLNTAAFFALGSLIMDAYSFTAGYQYVFRYCVSVVLLLIAIAYYRLRSGDPLHNTYWTKSMAMLTLGLASQFSGSSLTTWMAVQMVVLLVSARRSGLLVPRVLAIVLGAMTLVHGVITIADMALIPYHFTQFVARAAQGGFTVLGFLVASWLYQQTDWSGRSPQTGPFKEDVLYRLWQLDLVAEAPDSPSVKHKPLNGLLVPYYFAMAGSLLLMGYTARLIHLDDRALFLAVAALALAGAAVFLVSAPYGRCSVLLLFLAFVWGMNGISEGGLISYDNPFHMAHVIKAGVTIVMFLIMAEFARRTMQFAEFPVRSVFPSLGYLEVREPIFKSSFSSEAVGDKPHPLLPFFVALGGAFLLMAFDLTLMETGHRILPFALAALVLAGLAWALGALPLGLISIAMVVAALPIGSGEVMNHIGTWILTVSLLALAMTSLFSERHIVGSYQALAFHQFSAGAYFLYGVTFWLFGLYISYELRTPGDAVILTLAAVLAAGLINVFNVGVLACCSVALLIWAQLHWHISGAESSENWRHLLAGTLVCAALVGERYYNFKKLRILGDILLISAWFLALRYVYVEVDTSKAWVSFWWSLLGLGFLGYSLGVRSVTAGILAPVIVIFASAHHILRAYHLTLDTVPLIAGFMGPAIMWIVFERLTVLGGRRFKIQSPTWTSGVATGAATTLMVIMLERAPSLGDFYLTVSWSVLGMVLFALAIGFREKWYRFAGIAVLLLASVRVALWDTRELEAFQRVAAWAVLGAVLLVVGYGYIRLFGLRTDNASEFAESNELSEDPR